MTFHTRNSPDGFTNLELLTLLTRSVRKVAVLWICIWPDSDKLCFPAGHLVLSGQIPDNFLPLNFYSCFHKLKHKKMIKIT